LVEMIVSVFIFSILMMMISGTFVGFYKNYSKQKKVQKDIENAQYILNFMAKTLRTSYIANSSASPFDLSVTSLDTYDYSQGRCIQYFLQDNMVKYSLVPATDPLDCAFEGENYLSLSSANIYEAHVIAEQTSGDNKGKVTIVLYVQDQTPNQDKPSLIPIQSSVSLRQ